MSLFENYSRYQQQLQNDISTTREQITQLRQVIDDNQDLDDLVSHHNQVEEFKLVRQRVQHVLHYFTSNVSVLIELNNDVNNLIELYNDKSSVLLVRPSPSSRRQSHDSTASLGEVEQVLTPPPKKRENLLLFEEDEEIIQGSPTKIAQSPTNSSPKLNPSHFQSPPSPDEGFFNKENRIVSPLIEEVPKVENTPVLQPRDFFDQEVDIDDSLTKEGTVHTVHTEISTTTTIVGDEDTLTDDGDLMTDRTDDGDAPTPAPVFESPRLDKLKHSHSATELDKLLFGEEQLPNTPLGSIDVENAIQMLNRSPSTSMENIDIVPTPKPTSFELLDELIGTKMNGEIQSGTTTRILSMFDDDKPYVDLKRHETRNDQSPSTSAKSPTTTPTNTS